MNGTRGDEWDPVGKVKNSGIGSGVVLTCQAIPVHPTCRSTDEKGQDKVKVPLGTTGGHTPVRIAEVRSEHRGDQCHDETEAAHNVSSLVPTHLRNVVDNRGD